MLGHCRLKTVASAIALLGFAGALQAADDGSSERQSLEELRNTVVNLLQVLVDQGVMTREKAQQLVKQAQEKAAAESAKDAEAAKAEEGAVRVPYVPQIVKDEISKEVAEQVKPEVVSSVVDEAKSEKWGVPGALPEWLSRITVFGDLTLRGQADMYARGNQAALDFNGINAAGGESKDAFPYLDTTENRDRLRLRARLGLDATITPNLTAVMRLASGSLTDPSSDSPTEGTYGDRYSVAIDEAYLRWKSGNGSDPLPTFMAEGGRFESPWFAPTELVYARDLQFEGLAGTTRWAFAGDGIEDSDVFGTVAAVPMLEVPYEISENKWLLGAQLGTDLHWAGNQQFRFGAAYYDFLHVTGIANSPNSTLENPTAPAFIRYGNTVFDIANNTSDPTVQLFALAAHFRLVDLAATYELRFGRYSFGATADVVRNVGYNLAGIEALNPIQPVTSAQDRGYVSEISFGDPVVSNWGQWRARVGYRYVQSDAVIDAWTDADFHEGGTNAAGYYLWTDLGVAKNTWFRVRYFSGNQITGPRYGVDILQVDLNARF